MGGGYKSMLHNHNTWVANASEWNLFWFCPLFYTHACTRKCQQCFPSFSQYRLLSSVLRLNLIWWILNRHMLKGIDRQTLAWVEGYSHRRLWFDNTAFESLVFASGITVKFILCKWPTRNITVIVKSWRDNVKKCRGRDRDVALGL